MYTSQVGSEMGCTESSENSTDGEEVPKMEYASTCSIPTDFVKLPLLRKVILQMYIYLFVAFYPVITFIVDISSLPHCRNRTTTMPPCSHSVRVHWAILPSAILPTVYLYICRHTHKSVSLFLPFLLREAQKQQYVI